MEKELKTLEEAVLALIKQQQDLTGEMKEIADRIDGQTAIIVQQKTKTWLPSSKKEITTVVALVIFALSVLAIILAACGVIGCNKEIDHVELDSIHEPAHVRAQKRNNNLSIGSSSGELRRLQFDRSTGKNRLVASLGSLQSDPRILQISQSNL